MEVYKIKEIYDVTEREVSVCLCNMRADLQVVFIPYSEVKNWFGVDENNYSITNKIERGQKISAELCTKTRILRNVVFVK